MAAKELKFSFEARDRLLHGIDVLASAVRVTLGPRRRNVAIDRSYGAQITRQECVAKKSSLGNKFEGMAFAGSAGRQQASYRTARHHRPVVLARRQSGAKAVAAGMNPWT